MRILNENEIIAGYYNRGYESAENILVVKKNNNNYLVGVITPQPKYIKETIITPNCKTNHKFIKEYKYIKNGDYKIKMSEDVIFYTKLNYFDGVVGKLRIKNDCYLFVVKGEGCFLLKIEDEKFYFMYIEEDIIDAILNPEGYIEKVKNNLNEIKFCGIKIYSNEYEEYTIKMFIKCLSTMNEFKHERYFYGYKNEIILTKINDVYFIINKYYKTYFAIKCNEDYSSFDEFLYYKFDDIKISHLLKFKVGEVKIFIFKEKGQFNLIVLKKNNNKVIKELLSIEKNILCVKDIENIVNNMK